MKCLIVKASDFNYKEIKTINNIEELFKLHDSLILDNDDVVLDIYKVKGLVDCVVTIYDDWVE